jgi:hypothetical protein
MHVPRGLLAAAAWLAAGVLLAVTACGPRAASENPSPIDLSRAPEQTPLADPEPIHLAAGGYQFVITPLAHYVLRGVVVSEESYHFGWNAELSPCDVAVAWGELVAGRTLVLLALARAATVPGCVRGGSILEHTYRPGDVGAGAGRPLALPGRHRRDDGRAGGDRRSQGSGEGVVEIVAVARGYRRRVVRAALPSAPQGERESVRIEKTGKGKRGKGRGKTKNGRGAGGQRRSCKRKARSERI